MIQYSIHSVIKTCISCVFNFIVCLAAQFLEFNAPLILRLHSPLKANDLFPYLLWNDACHVFFTAPLALLSVTDVTS